MLSIIVPVLDEAGHVVDTLSRLARFRRAGHEIIVVDGGSRDRTVALTTPLAHRVIVTEPGRARQMNAGARIACGEILWFLHADTRAPADAVERIAQALAAGLGWGRFDVRLSGRPVMLRAVERLMNARSRLTGLATGDQGIFVSSALFHRVGGFPELPLMEDIALSRLLRRHGRPACLRGPLVTSSRRWEEHGIWRTILLMWRLRLAYAFGADPATLHRRYYRPPPGSPG